MSRSPSSARAARAAAPSASLVTEPFAATCADGVLVRGEVVLPQGEPKGLVQFNAGTAAKLRFYRAFLDHVAAHGYAYALWDYRGFGASRPKSLVDSPYTFADFGLQDIPAVKTYLRSTYPSLPLVMIAHSAGGQQLPFVTDLSGVRGLLCYAVSTGYTRRLAWYYRPQARALWHVVGPLLQWRYGYVAASKVGLMEDLPTELFREWRRWCTSPDYFFDERFYGRDVPRVDWSRLDFPIRHVHATSDEISTVANVGTFWRHWQTPRPIEQQVLEPASFGGQPIRHFDYFRRRFRDTLWVEAVAWLDGVTA